MRERGGGLESERGLGATAHAAVGAVARLCGRRGGGRRRAYTDTRAVHLQQPHGRLLLLMMELV